MSTPVREHWLDHPRNVGSLRRGFLAILALTLAVGFVTCLLMIVGAKALGILLKRSDRYYARDERDE